MTFDQRVATILALIAEAPQQNQSLVNSLTGEARSIAQALIDPSSARRASIRRLADEIRAWVAENRRQVATSKRPRRG